MKIISWNCSQALRKKFSLLEKYNALAKEALSSGDRILSENYLQHVDHFERIISSKNLNQNENKSQETNPTKVENSNPSNSDQTEQAQKIEK